MRKQKEVRFRSERLQKKEKVNFSVQVPMGKKRVNFCFTEKETQSRKSALTCRRKKA